MYRCKLGTANMIYWYTSCTCTAEHIGSHEQQLEIRHHSMFKWGLKHISTADCTKWPVCFDWCGGICAIHSMELRPSSSQKRDWVRGWCVYFGKIHEHRDDIPASCPYDITPQDPTCLLASPCLLPSTLLHHVPLIFFEYLECTTHINGDHYLRIKEWGNRKLGGMCNKQAFLLCTLVQIMTLDLVQLAPGKYFSGLVIISRDEATFS